MENKNFVPGTRIQVIADRTLVGNLSGLTGTVIVDPQPQYEHPDSVIVTLDEAADGATFIFHPTHLAQR